MKTQVFLDVDGVLADLVKGIAAYFKIPNPYDNPANLGNYHLDKILGMDADSFWGPLGYDFWENLDFMDDAHAILFRVFHHVTDKQVTLLTSPISTPGCAEGKLSWVRKKLPKFHRRTLVGSNKEAIAAPGKLLIDDYDRNVDAWIEAGGPAIQVPRPWNRLHNIPTLDYVANELKRYFDGTGEKLVQKP
jgi:5'(3')-deoxyribonucleotidase